MNIITRCWRRPFYPSDKLAYYEKYASASQHLRWWEENPQENIVEICLGFDRNNNPVFENDIIGRCKIGNEIIDVVTNASNMGDDFSDIEVLGSKRESELEEVD